MAKGNRGQIKGTVEETEGTPHAGEQIDPQGADSPAASVPSEQGGATLVDAGQSPMASTEPPPPAQDMVDAAEAQQLLDEAAMKLDEATQTIAVLREELAAKEHQVASLEAEVRYVRSHNDRMAAELGQRAAGRVEPEGPKGEPRGYAATCQTGVLRRSTREVQQLAPGDMVPKDADPEDLESGIRRGIFILVY